MSTRPSEWAPLTGGDPCPGDPEAYASVIQHWGNRAADARSQGQKLGSITAQDADSNRIRKVEHMASEGKLALESMARTFDEVQELLRGWQKDLGDLQARADEALRKAQDAHTTVEDSSAQIGALGAFAAAQKKKDAQGEAKKAHLVQEMAAAQVVIDVAQQEVDDVRGEYGRKSAAVVGAYMLNVSGLWSVDGKSSAGGFGVSVADVKDTLLGYLSESKARELEDAAAHAGDGPQQYEAYLKLLAGLDAKALGEFFSVRPELARYPLAGTGDAVWDTATVKAWWGKLGADQQQALVQNASGVVGNLNGVPYGARDEANRALIEELLVDDGIAQSTKDTLLKIREAAQTSDDEDTKKFILALDFSNTLVNDDSTYNDVMAAVSVGDVDTAAKTTMIVPGMDNNVDGSIASLVDTASAVYKEQDIPGGGKHATVAWIGYESPQLSQTIDLNPVDNFTFNSDSVLRPDKAYRGGLVLADFYDGLNVTKSANTDIPAHGADPTDAYNDPFVSLTAHSYGTTTAAVAMTQSRTKVDNTVFYDSAGVDLPSVVQEWQGKWQVESRGDQQNIFFTNVAPNESVVARSGAFGGGRVVPQEWDLRGATEFSSRGGFDASGNYLEDADEHGLFERNGKRGSADYRFVQLMDGDADGILSPGTSSLYYGSRISLGDYGVAGKKLISPVVVGNEWDPESGSYPYREVGDDGKLSADEVRKYAQEQGIEVSDLVNLGEGNHE